MRVESNWNWFKRSLNNNFSGMIKWPIYLYTTAAKATKFLEWHYTMIQFLILINNSRTQAENNHFVTIPSFFFIHERAIGKTLCMLDLTRIITAPPPPSPTEWSCLSIPALSPAFLFGFALWLDGTHWYTLVKKEKVDWSFFLTSFKSQTFERANPLYQKKMATGSFTHNS